MVRVAVDDGRRVDIEAAITDTARQMTERGADVAALSARLVALHAERDALPATSPTEVQRVPTGRTFAETWADRDADGRRALLASALECVNVRKGTQGRKTFDPSRVEFVWHPDAPTPTTD